MWLWKRLGIYKEVIVEKEVPPPKQKLNIGDKVTINYLLQAEEGVVIGEPFYSNQLPGLVTLCNWCIPVRLNDGKVANPPAYLVFKIEG